MLGINNSTYKISEKITHIVLILFIFSLPVSKAGINFFGGLFTLITVGVILKNNNKEKFLDFYKKNRLMLDFLFLFLLGIVVNTLSDGGLKSLKIYFFKHLYFLMIPGFLIYGRKKSYVYFLSVYLISFLIGELKSLEVFYKRYDLNYNYAIRNYSFYGVGRWASILLFSLMILLPLLIKSDSKANKKSFVLMVTTFTLGNLSLILSNSRGAWVGFVVCIFIYFLAYNMKKIKYVSLLIIFIGLFINFLKPDYLNSLKTRVSTISDINNISNKGRLIMWREGLLFARSNILNKRLYIGTGVGNMEGDFKLYLEKKGVLDSLMQESGGQLSLNDNHNSFINILNQLGLVYFSYYIYLMIKLFIYYYKKSKESDEGLNKSIFILLCSFVVCGMFYSYSLSYEMYTLFFFITLGFVTNKGEK